ncbi:MAG TPA: glycosyltransferase family A protein [Candidatus Margulisiibacteriota bacterium]|nr:glycosyltransferase family A protein [Candidatus Margulisiibacteriota bacterium]
MIAPFSSSLRRLFWQLAGMFSSTIIPTINRPTLSRAVCSVLAQKLAAADFEVIVVNDSGHPLPDMEWQHCQGVRVVSTDRRERCVARNTGAAIARGRYFHFLDDDDVLLPDALQALWRLSLENPQVAWLYGSYQTVDDDGNLIEEVHPGICGNIFPHLVCGESIPLQTSLLLRTYFDAAGRFDPLLIGTEDRDLGRRIALRGAVACTAAVVAKIRIGERGSTTVWNLLAENDRRGREKALSNHGALVRIRSSPLSSYWHGRVSRAYFASSVWNLKRKQILTAASRARAGFALASWCALSPDFWNGLRTKIK